MRPIPNNVRALCGAILIGVVALVYGVLELNWFEPANPFGDPVLQRARDDVIVAAVDRSAILRAQVYSEAVIKGLVQDGQPFDIDGEDGQQIVEELIDQRVLANEARRLGLDNDPTARPRLVLAQDRALSEILLRRLIEQRVTEDSLKALYDQQLETLRLDEEVRARHILVPTEDEARQLMARLRAGADFARLARTQSIDEASAKDGGDLGYFTRAAMVEPFADVAFSTSAGEVSEPFETQFGWHIVKVEDRRQRRAPTFEELRPQLLRFKTFEVVRSEIERLRSAATIDYLN